MPSFAGPARLLLAALVTTGASAASDEGVGPARPPQTASRSAPAGAAGEDDAIARGDYDTRLRELEERVRQLKEKIFRSRARLIQLQEVVLHGTVARAKAVLRHRNELGDSFRLVRAQYALDGAPVFNRVESDDGGGELGDAEEIEVYAGSVAPGRHRISVYLEYQGRAYGIFSYLGGYRFKVRSSHTFTADEGKVTTVRIVGYDRGGITTGFEDRPAVRYETAVSLEAAGADAGSGAVPVP